MRVVVVGAGVIGSEHCRQLKELGCDMLAIVDSDMRSREAFKHEYGFRLAMPDYRQALSLGADLAVICVPNAYHAPIAIDFLQNGTHVICEKPMARTVAECDSMMDAAARSGQRLFIAHSQQFRPMHRKLIADVKAGVVGTPFMAAASFIGNEYARMNDANSWKGTYDISGGGVLIDNGVHMINLLVAMFGRARDVIAQADRLVVEPTNKADDCAHAVIRFDNGVMAQVTVTFVARQSVWPSNYCGAAHRVEVYGTGGSAVATNDTPNYQTSLSNGQRCRLNADELSDIGPVNEDAYFISCLTENKESVVTTEDAREAVAIVQAAYLSSAEGRRVNLRELR